MADYKLVLVPTNRVRDLYHEHVAWRLIDVKKRCNEAWHPEDFYRLLLNGTVTLGTLALNGKIVGIVILQSDVDLLTQQRGLFVWIAHLDSLHGILTALEEQIDSLTAEHDYDYVQFSSPRSGWLAAAIKRKGSRWNQKTVIWEKHYGQWQGTQAGSFSTGTHTSRASGGEVE